LKCEWDSETPLNAAKNGHPECLKYCVESGCPVSTQTFCSAIIGNNEECLECLWTNNCPIDENIVVYVVTHSKLTAFKFLNEMNFPLNRIQCSKLAFIYDSKDILEYIRDHMRADTQK
jgi:hypothetical protein